MNFPNPPVFSFPKGKKGK